MKIRSFAIGAVVAVLVAACGGNPPPAAQSSGSAAPQADIKVGLAISLTGAANVYGPAQQKGAQLAVEQINAAGGINGAKIALLIEDDASARDQGITVFRKLINEDKVAAILGPTLSGVAAGAHPVAQQAGMPVIAISNTGAGIVGKCDYGACDWIFRASLCVEHIRLLGAGSDQDSLGVGAEIFRPAAAANGIPISRTIPYKTADVDF